MQKAAHVGGFLLFLALLLHLVAGFGHSLGMECHEWPNCSPSGKVPMEVNMITSAEPGIYWPGKFGVRIEDVVIFTEDGCENITHSPKNLIIVEV